MIIYQIEDYAHSCGNLNTGNQDEAVQRHRAKKLTTYSPYNVAMRKIEGNVEARQVIAPESGIKTENTNKRHMNSRRHTMVTKGKQVAAAATSRIPVSRAVWAELSSLRKPGQTYDHLLEEMIEREKKQRLFEDMDRIEKRGKFVAMKW